LLKNNFAWALATASNPELRDGARAVRLAEEANRLSNGRDPVVLRTLAAAYAEDRQYSRAAETAENAASMVNAFSDPRLYKALRDEADVYASGRAYPAGYR
jgi:hypothetical protein